MMTRHRSYVLAAAAAVFTPPALAEEVYDLGSIVVSGNLSPVERGRTGATIEVLEGADAGDNDSAVIRRLDRLPGVHSTGNGGLGGTSTIQIRGLPARYVGVRINGIDMADPSGPQKQFDFGGLTASGIGRIEVLKGSQSALYGSEAIAGVVDITTFRPEKLGFSGQAEVEAGSFDTYSGTLSAGYRTERGFVALSYGRIETDGISARSFNTEKDGFEQSTITFSGEYDVSDAVTVGAALIHRTGEVDIDGFPPTITGTNQSDELGARVFTTLRTGLVSHTLAYNHFDLERKDPSGLISRFTGERQKISYLGSADLSARTVLNFGLEHTEQTFSTLTARGTEDDTAVKAELLIAATDRIDISAALRHDDNSTFGGQATGRLAAVWRPMDDLAFRAVIGSGYRAPSLFERFGPNGVATLQPEDSLSYELGVEKTLAGRGYVKATVFYTEIEDLIDYVPGGAGCASPWGCYNQIPGTTTSRGVELSGEYAVTPAVNVFGSYTYTNARTGGMRLTKSPRHDLALGVEADFTDRFSGYLDLRHVADVVPSAFAPAGHKVGDYTLVGTGVSYDVTDSAALYLRVENLFDEDYETSGGFNQPGRAAYVGLRATF